MYELSLERWEAHHVVGRGRGLPGVARCSPWTARARLPPWKRGSATSLMAVGIAPPSLRASPNAKRR
jgi:hypothetical protein